MVERVEARAERFFWKGRSYLERDERRVFSLFCKSERAASTSRKNAFALGENAPKFPDQLHKPFKTMIGVIRDFGRKVVEFLVDFLRKGSELFLEEEHVSFSNFIYDFGSGVIDLFVDVLFECGNVNITL
ncbi:histidinol phosphate aminotransferase, putative [Babesia ovata]|uniref:Histidinol phosphate aminotransferase, putative n=1 Tax=Babesia ovata TaxID=189622 RepID=A0A2H6KKH2_9APIC|nr:histidinol phosphate aminotransferase, putative [Babesia ovata]GBE63493.1 histidinol phosphate aminotransferase, putative [Babesia ovata]